MNISNNNDFKINSSTDNSSSLNNNIHRRHIKNNKNKNYIQSNYIDGSSKLINKCLNSSQDNSNMNNSISIDSSDNIDIDTNSNEDDEIDNSIEINLEDYDIEIEDENDELEEESKDNELDENEDNEQYLNGDLEYNNYNRCEICYVRYKRLVSFGSSSLIKINKLECNQNIENNHSDNKNQLSFKKSLCKHKMCKKCSIKTFESFLEKNKEICCLWCGEGISEVLISELLGIDYKLIMENKKLLSISLLKWECPSCQDKSLILFNNISKIIISIDKLNYNSNNNLDFNNNNKNNNNSIINNSNKINKNSNNNNKVICKTCSYIFCFTCNESHNLNQSCEEFLMKDESLLKTFKWKQSNTKRCPNCFVFIEKRGGCSFMRCLNCGFEFCFECLSTYKKFHQCDNSEMIFKIIFMICAIIGSIYIVYLLKKAN